METVTVIRPVPGGTDKYGDRIDTEPVTDPVRTDLENCWIAPIDSPETHRHGRTGRTQGLTLYCTNPTADVRSTDKIERNGVVFDIEGEPAVWEAGITVDLYRTAG